MFRSKYVFPNSTPLWALNQQGRQMELWVMRREDEMRVTLFKRLFG